MKPLLNTLYVNQDEAYLALDGNNVVVRRENKELARFPLHNFEQITTFGYTGASPALMRKCAEDNIALTFMTPSFCAKNSTGVRTARRNLCPLRRTLSSEKYIMHVGPSSARAEIMCCGLTRRNSEVLANSSKRRAMK